MGSMSMGWRTKAEVFGILLLTLAAVQGIGAVTARIIGDETTIVSDPTGPYAVGRVDYDVTDTARPEVFASQTGRRRELLLSVYYPARMSTAKPLLPLVSGRVAEEFSRSYGIPLDFATSLRVRARQGADLASQPLRYPVLLFSPGWGEDPLAYAPTLEDVASHGYVVVAIWHTYSCNFTPFPDGRIVYAVKAASDPDHYADEQSDSAQLRVRTLVGSVWADDVRFVLGWLAHLDASDAKFAGRLDLMRIGMFGHSFGGTVALELGKRETRLKAVADMDGGLTFRHPDGRGMAMPVLLMRSDDPQLSDAELAQAGMTRQQYRLVLANQTQQFAAVARNSQPGYIFGLKGTTHLTYESLEARAAPFLGTQVPASVIGSIDGRRAVLIYDAYLVAFFDASLNQARVPLLDGSSASYPEVSLVAYR